MVRGSRLIMGHTQHTHTHFLSLSREQTWREFHDCNHLPTWVEMTVTLPYAQAGFPEDMFKGAIKSAVFGGGPPFETAVERVLILSVLTTAAGSTCAGDMPCSECERKKQGQKQRERGADMTQRQRFGKRSCILQI